ncbi:MAG: dodecin domain-containing protein [Armatimonadetes bacterium]|nr:dodecin domain-containing protein [Armatimonadota bacterium]
MSVYKMIEVVGTSNKSLSEAIQSAVERTAQTVRNTSWFEVIEQRGTIVNGKVGEYQVKLAIGFRIDE